jgi:hypothetical protein
MSLNKNRNENRNENQSKYAIFQCSNCKRWLYARAVQKTTKCGLCQKINRIPEHPQYSTDKPTTALTKIKELNAKNHQIANNELEFESKGKYKPVKLSRVINNTEIKPQIKEAKKRNSEDQSLETSKSRVSNKDAFSDETSKATIALKNFQIDKRIEPTQGIPLNLVPIILKNAGITSLTSQKIIELLLHRKILQYTKNKTAIYVL